MNETGTPFNGLLSNHATPVVQRYAGGFRWEFHADDSNESARALLRRLDGLFEILAKPGFVFLPTIELDVEAGRFPDLLVQNFGDEDWDYDRRFFIAEMKQTSRTSEYQVGRLTFEAMPGQTRRILAQNGGFRWGTNLRVWGLQVPEDQVADAIRMSPDNADQLCAAHRLARAAWLADDDLCCLGLWVSAAVSRETRDRLAELKTD